MTFEHGKLSILSYITFTKQSMTFKSYAPSQSPLKAEFGTDLGFMPSKVNSSLVDEEATIEK